MLLKNRLAGIALALGVIGVSAVAAQSSLVELLRRHGVQTLEDKSRRNQARGYLDELGAPAP